MSSKKSLALILMIILCMCAFFVTACAEKTQLSQPTNVAYDGEMLTWSAVEGAVNYEISINGGEKQVVNALSYTYDADFSEFSVTIKAISADGAEYDSTELTVNFKPLDTVSNVRMDEGCLTWDLVEGATAYIVSVNNTETIVDVNEFSKLKGGVNSVRVRAIVKGNNSYYSTWSNIQNFTLLDSPTGLKYNNKTDKITWDSVRNAKGYILNINGEKIDCITNEYTLTAKEVGELEISVLAKADENQGSVYSSAFSDTVVYEFLQPIESLEEKDGGIAWSLIEGATYQVEVKEGDRVIAYEETNKAYYTDFEPGKNYTVRVRVYPENERQFSTWSEEFNVYFLSAPTLEWLGQNSDTNVGFNITTVPGESAKISGYTIRITRPDKQVLTMSSAGGSFSEYDFNEGAGEYTIQVKANPKTLDGYYEFSSGYSESIKIIRLAAVSNIKMTEQENITFSGVSNARGYKYIIDGNEYDIGTNTGFPLEIDNPDGQEKTVKLSIYALGSDGQPVNGKYILGCTTPAEQTVTKLATVTKPSIKDNRISWSQIVDASKYEIVTDEATENTVNSNYSVKITSAGKHEVKIRAIGNPSAFIMNGEYSEVLTIYKLSTPEITNITDAGIMTWSYVPFEGTQGYGKGYEVTIGSKALSSYIEMNQNSVDLSKNISTAVQGVNIVVKGNGAEILDSEGSNTIRTVKVAKLTTITNLALKNNANSITWSKVDNASQYVFGYSTSGEQASEDTSTTTYDKINAWKAGEYTVTVKAKGYKTQDGNTYYVQSEETTATFRKLAAPEIKKEGNAYTWAAVDYAQNGYSIVRSGYDIIEAVNAGGTWKYVPDFNRTNLGTLTVKFQANGDDMSRIISSNEVVINQTITALSKPSVTRTQNDATKSFMITAGKIEGAKYTFIVNGVERPVQESNIYEFTPENSGNYEFIVIAKGGFFSGDVYFVDSEKSEAVNATVLNPVKDITVVSCSNGKLILKWTNPDNGSCIVVPNKGSVTASDKTSCTITGVSSGDNLEIKIVVSGNGSTTFNSPEVVYYYTVA